MPVFVPPYPDTLHEWDGLGMAHMSLYAIRPFSAVRGYARLLHSYAGLVAEHARQLDNS